MPLQGVRELFVLIVALTEVCRCSSHHSYISLLKASTTSRTSTKRSTQCRHPRHHGMLAKPRCARYGIPRVRKLPCSVHASPCSGTTHCADWLSGYPRSRSAMDMDTVAPPAYRISQVIDAQFVFCIWPHCYSMAIYCFLGDEARAVFPGVDFRGCIIEPRLLIAVVSQMSCSENCTLYGG